MISVKSQEKIGELFILGQLVLYGLFPVLVNHTTKLMPPILFGGLSTLVAGVTLFLYLLIAKQLHFILNKKVFLYILGVALFIVIIPSIFIYVGTSKTSGTNTAILLQTEILFTFIIAGLFFKEKITLQKIIGGIVIVIGAIAVLWNGTFHVNLGDIFVIVGTAFYPFGNWFAKKALQLTKPGIILFVRNIFGGAFLVFLSFVFEKYDLTPAEYIFKNWIFIILTGVVVYSLAKLLWYEGLKRLDLSKAIPLGMAFPAFSLIYAFFFLHEVPTMYQIFGFLIIMLGLLLITKTTRKDVIKVGLEI